MDGTDSGECWASELFRANDIASELLGRYGGHLTPWEPAELEGEPRGVLTHLTHRYPLDPCHIAGVLP